MFCFLYCCDKCSDPKQLIVHYWGLSSDSRRNLKQKPWGPVESWCSYDERYSRPEPLQGSKHSSIASPHNSTKVEDAFKRISKCLSCKHTCPAPAPDRHCWANWLDTMMDHRDRWFIPNDPSRQSPHPHQGHITKSMPANLPKVRTLLGWVSNSMKQEHRLLRGQNHESMNILFYPLRKHSLLTGFTHRARFPEKHFLPCQTRQRLPSLPPRFKQQLPEDPSSTDRFQLRRDREPLPSVGHMSPTGKVT